MAVSRSSQSLRNKRADRVDRYSVPNHRVQRQCYERESNTGFLGLIRGILLKGNWFPDMWPDLWPLIAFTVVVMTVAVLTYRRTLD